LQTNEKMIQQFVFSLVKKIVNKIEPEDFYFLVTAQFYEFNEENSMYELNNKYRILLDI